MRVYAVNIVTLLEFMVLYAPFCHPGAQQLRELFIKAQEKCLIKAPEKCRESKENNREDFQITINMHGNSD